ncbi:hypothetical protein RR48_10529 [Papilio machaon]|uniref:Uncharacterized protein n=1 Tax=Papilio machaon TaxID=76193 RepID=A0A194R5W0_PAPMA|nr:hypothetical protein RR48_10529 [Papilio machaon]
MLLGRNGADAPRPHKNRKSGARCEQSRAHSTSTCATGLRPAAHCTPFRFIPFIVSIYRVLPLPGAKHI